jgi:hypothetical protein
MTIAIILWFSIGAAVNMYLHIENAHRINSILMSGPLGVLVMLAIGVANHFVWPLSLYFHVINK